MDATAASLIATFDYVWARLTARLAGLTDDEYFWEPVASCWSLRQADDGRWLLDGGGGGGGPASPVAERLRRRAHEDDQRIARQHFHRALA